MIVEGFLYNMYKLVSFVVFYYRVEFLWLEVLDFLIDRWGGRLMYYYSSISIKGGREIFGRIRLCYWNVKLLKLVFGK